MLAGCAPASCDASRLVCRRSNTVRVTKRPSMAEGQCRRAVSVSGRPHTVTRGGWTVRGWPVVMPVSRIILRSTVDESALYEPDVC